MHFKGIASAAGQLRKDEANGTRQQELLWFSPVDVKSSLLVRVRVHQQVVRVRFCRRET